MTSHHRLKGGKIKVVDDDMNINDSKIIITIDGIDFNTQNNTCNLKKLFESEGIPYKGPANPDIKTAVQITSISSKKIFDRLLNATVYYTYLEEMKKRKTEYNTMQNQLNLIVNERDDTLQRLHEINETRINVNQNEAMEGLRQLQTIHDLLTNESDKETIAEIALFYTRSCAGKYIPENVSAQAPDLFDVLTRSMRLVDRERLTERNDLIAAQQGQRDAEAQRAAAEAQRATAEAQRAAEEAQRIAAEARETLAQQAQHDAEEAQRNAEEAQHRAEEAQHRAEEAQHRAEEAQHNAEARFIAAEEEAEKTRAFYEALDREIESITTTNNRLTEDLNSANILIADLRHRMTRLTAAPRPAIGDTVEVEITRDNLAGRLEIVRNYAEHIKQLGVDIARVIHYSNMVIDDKSRFNGECVNISANRASLIDLQCENAQKILDEEIILHDNKGNLNELNSCVRFLEILRTQTNVARELIEDLLMLLIQVHSKCRLITQADQNLINFALETITTRNETTYTELDKLEKEIKDSASSRIETLEQNLEIDLKFLTRSADYRNLYNETLRYVRSEEYKEAITEIKSLIPGLPRSIDGILENTYFVTKLNIFMTEVDPKLSDHDTISRYIQRITDLYCPRPYGVGQVINNAAHATDGIGRIVEIIKNIRANMPLMTRTDDTNKTIAHDLSTISDRTAYLRSIIESMTPVRNLLDTTLKPEYDEVPDAYTDRVKNVKASLQSILNNVLKVPMELRTKEKSIAMEQNFEMNENVPFKGTIDLMLIGIASSDNTLLTDREASHTLHVIENSKLLIYSHISILSSLLENFEDPNTIKDDAGRDAYPLYDTVITEVNQVIGDIYNIFGELDPTSIGGAETDRTIQAFEFRALFGIETLKELHAIKDKTEIALGEADKDDYKRDLMFTLVKHTLSFCISLVKDFDSVYSTVKSEIDTYSLDLRRRISNTEVGEIVKVSKEFLNQVRCCVFILNDLISIGSTTVLLKNNLTDLTSCVRNANFSKNNKYSFGRRILDFDRRETTGYYYDRIAGAKLNAIRIAKRLSEHHRDYPHFFSSSGRGKPIYDLFLDRLADPVSYGDAADALEDIEIVCSPKFTEDGNLLIEDYENIWFSIKDNNELIVDEIPLPEEAELINNNEHKYKIKSPLFFITFNDCRDMDMALKHTILYGLDKLKEYKNKLLTCLDVMDNNHVEGLAGDAFSVKDEIARLKTVDISCIRYMFDTVTYVSDRTLPGFATDKYYRLVYNAELPGVIDENLLVPFPADNKRIIPYDMCSINIIDEVMGHELDRIDRIKKGVDAAAEKAKVQKWCDNFKVVYEQNKNKYINMMTELGFHKPLIIKGGRRVGSALCGGGGEGDEGDEGDLPPIVIGAPPPPPPAAPPPPPAGWGEPKAPKAPKAAAAAPEPEPEPVELFGLKINDADKDRLLINDYRGPTISLGKQMSKNVNIDKVSENYDDSGALLVQRPIDEDKMPENLSLGTPSHPKIPWMWQYLFEEYRYCQAHFMHHAAIAKRRIEQITGIVDYTRKSGEKIEFTKEESIAINCTNVNVNYITPLDIHDPFLYKYKEKLFRDAILNKLDNALRKVLCNNYGGLPMQYKLDADTVTVDTQLKDTWIIMLKAARDRRICSVLNSTIFHMNGGALDIGIRAPIPDRITNAMNDEENGVPLLIIQDPYFRRFALTCMVSICFSKSLINEMDSNYTKYNEQSFDTATKFFDDLNTIKFYTYCREIMVKKGTCSDDDIIGLWQMLNVPPVTFMKELSSSNVIPGSKILLRNVYDYINEERAAYENFMENTFIAEWKNKPVYGLAAEPELNEAQRADYVRTILPVLSKFRLGLIDMLKHLRRNRHHDVIFHGQYKKSLYNKPFNDVQTKNYADFSRFYYQLATVCLFDDVYDKDDVLDRIRTSDEFRAIMTAPDCDIKAYQFLFYILRTLHDIYNAIVNECKLISQAPDITLTERTNLWNAIYERIVRLLKNFLTIIHDTLMVNVKEYTKDKYNDILGTEGLQIQNIINECLDALNYVDPDTRPRTVWDTLYDSVDLFNVRNNDLLRDRNLYYTINKQFSYDENIIGNDDLSKLIYNPEDRLLYLNRNGTFMEGYKNVASDPTCRKEWSTLLAELSLYIPILIDPDKDNYKSSYAMYKVLRILDNIVNKALLAEKDAAIAARFSIKEAIVPKVIPTIAVPAAYTEKGLATAPMVGPAAADIPADIIDLGTDHDIYRGNTDLTFKGGEHFHYRMTGGAKPTLHILDFDYEEVANWNGNYARGEARKYAKNLFKVPEDVDKFPFYYGKFYIDFTKDVSKACDFVMRYIQYSDEDIAGYVVREKVNHIFDYKIAKEKPLYSEARDGLAEIKNRLIGTHTQQKINNMLKSYELFVDNVICNSLFNTVNAEGNDQLRRHGFETFKDFCEHSYLTYTHAYMDNGIGPAILSIIMAMLVYLTVKGDTDMYDRLQKDADATEEDRLNGTTHPPTPYVGQFVTDNVTPDNGMYIDLYNKKRIAIDTEWAAKDIVFVNNMKNDRENYMFGSLAIFTGQFKTMSSKYSYLFDSYKVVTKTLIPYMVNIFKDHGVNSNSIRRLQIAFSDIEVRDSNNKNVKLVDIVHTYILNILSLYTTLVQVKNFIPNLADKLYVDNVTNQIGAKSVKDFIEKFDINETLCRNLMDNMCNLIQNMILTIPVNKGDAYYNVNYLVYHLFRDVISSYDARDIYGFLQTKSKDNDPVGDVLYMGEDVEYYKDKADVFMNDPRNVKKINEARISDTRSFNNYKVDTDNFIYVEYADKVYNMVLQLLTFYATVGLSSRKEYSRDKETYNTKATNLTFLRTLRGGAGKSQYINENTDPRSIIQNVCKIIGEVYFEDNPLAALKFRGSAHINKRTESTESLNSAERETVHKIIQNGSFMSLVIKILFLMLTIILICVIVHMLYMHAKKRKLFKSFNLFGIGRGRNNVSRFTLRRTSHYI